MLKYHKQIRLSTNRDAIMQLERAADGEVYFAEDKALLKLTDDSLAIMREFEEKITVWSSNGEYLLVEYFLIPNSKFILNVSTKQFEDHPELQAFPTTRNTSALPNICIFDTSLHCTKLYNLKTHAIEWETEGYKNLKYLNEHYLFWNQLTRFSIHSVKTGETLWQYTLPPSYDWVARGGLYPPEGERQPAQIERIIGAYLGVVWVGLNTGRLLGLAIQTGELLHDLALPTHRPYEMHTFSFASRTYLDSQRGMLLGYRFQFYWELNLTNPKESYTLYDLSDELNSHGVEMEMPGQDRVFDATYLYFYDSSRAVVGAIERATRRVVWTHQLEVKGAGLAKLLQIQYLRDRLYVLDATSYLHIFQREA